MSKVSSNSVLAQSAKSHRELQSLAFYEPQSVGNEFAAHLPKGAEQRARVQRRDLVILNNWRSVRAGKGTQCAEDSRNNVLSMRDYETKRVLDSERMFVMVLATMTFFLGCIFLYFVMNFRF